MRCPACRHESSRVLDSRESGAEIRRRRRCEACGERFTTFERIEAGALSVRKRSGEIARFQPAKLRDSILRAASKGIPSPQDVDRLVERVERALSTGRSTVVTSREIARHVLVELAHIDPVSHDRFAADYETGEDGTLAKRTRQTTPEPEVRQLPLFEPEARQRPGARRARKE